MAFGYFEHIFDESNRLSVVAGAPMTASRFRTAQACTPPTSVRDSRSTGRRIFLSNLLNENQREVTQFAALSLQHSRGPLSVQTSLITRYSSLNFSPDPLGDLLFNGISAQAYKRDVAYGLQSDGACKLTDSHTLRAGVYAQNRPFSRATPARRCCRPMPAACRPATCPSASSTTSAIPSGSRARICRMSGTFNSALVVNYGVRFDSLRGVLEAAAS